MKNYLFLFVVLLLFSCTQNEKPNNELNTNISKNETLSIIKAISIPCDTLPYSFEYSSVYQENNELYFVGLDESTNALYFYSITNQKFSHKIQKPMEGNEKFIIKDFHIYTKDSIFLLDDRKGTIELVDNTGKQLSLVDYGKIIVPEQTGFVEADNSKRFVYSKEWNAFVMPTYPEIEFESKEFYKHRFLTLFFHKNDSVYTVGKYPSNIIPNDEGFFYSSLFPVVHLMKDKFILNFSNNHFLFQLSPISNELKEIVKWKSNYIDEDFERLPMKYEFQEAVNYNSVNGYYTNLSLDIETETLYRIVKHPQPLKNAEGKLNQYLECGFSIMYGKLNDPNPKEVLLEKGKYVPYVVHSIGNNQLLISLENSFNPNNKENRLEFEIIELK